MDVSEMTADQLNAQRWLAKAAGDDDTLTAVAEEFKQRQAETAEWRKASAANLRARTRAARKQVEQDRQDIFRRGPWGGAS